MRAGQLPIDRQVAQFRAALRRNRTLTEVLARAATMDLPGWYLVAGCLYQTVWNVVTGQPPEAGILDYDLAYFDGSDLSWVAEDAIIRAGHQIFAGLPAPVQIRNQARVHLWYEQKFGVPCRPHESAEAAIDTYEATTACLGVRLRPGGRWRIYAPHGLGDVFNLVVRPNPVLAPRRVYQAKTTRWRRQWPGLTVLPWPERPGPRAEPGGDVNQRPRLRVSGTNLDCPDAHVLADFYRRLLGWEVAQDQPDDVVLSPPGGGPGLSFQTERQYARPTWPAHPGDQQMMMHLEIEVDDLAAGVAHAVAEGATLAEYQPQDDVRVCLDPAGHPFCLWIAT